MCAVQTISGSLFSLGARSAQVCPVNVRSQLFTANGSARCALDCWAALRRDAALSGHPLMDGGRLHSKKARQGGEPAAQFARPCNRGFGIHTIMVRRRLIAVNRNCLTSILRGLLGDA